MGLKFMQNAEAARKKVNKAKVEELRQALADDGKSDKTDEGEKEVNDGGRMIFGARRRRRKEAVVGKPGPDKCEFEEAERSSKDGDGEDSLDETEATMVNKPSFQYTQESLLAAWGVAYTIS